jgi:8-amino-7-oxononanoate synthase
MKATKKFIEHLQRELEQRKKSHLYRILRPLDNSKIDFFSNDYLGLNFDGILKQFLKKILTSYDDITVGSTGSRLISGHRVLFEEIEYLFSKYIENESSLLFHSGYIANIATIFGILTPRDYAFVDRLCHASILDGIRISGSKKVYFEHNDLNHLEEQLKKIERKRNSYWWIFTESIFSMDGDLPPIQELIQLALKYECNIFIDEAHSIGIIGPKGKGLIASHKIQDQITITTFPMGKAPGLMGCFVSGHPIIKEYLINYARGFIYSTAQPILLLYLIKSIIEYLQSEDAENRRKKTIYLSEYARKTLIEKGFNIGMSQSHIIPIIVREEDKVITITDNLQKKGFNVIGIRPPSVPKNTSRLRLNIHTHNTKEEIDQLIEELTSLRNKIIF